MEIVDSNPLDCMKPLLGVLVGFGLGLLAALYVHPDWEETFHGFMFPRWLGLNFSIVLWGVGTLSRRRQIHCGGLNPMTNDDAARYGLIGMVVIFVLVASVFAYAFAQTLWFVVLTVLLLLMVLSEVGYGKPWAFINVLMRLER